MKASVYNAPQRPDVPMPEQPKPKVSKLKVFAVIGAAVFGLAAVSVVLAEQDSTVPVTVSPMAPNVTPEPSPTEEAPVPEDEFVVTPAMIADQFSNKEIGQFCKYVPILGYEKALKAFKGGYGNTQNPSAEELFAYIVNQEC